MSTLERTPPPPGWSGVGVPGDPAPTFPPGSRYRGVMAENLPADTPDSGTGRSPASRGPDDGAPRDSDGIPDQLSVEDTIVTPLDRRDVYRFFWVANQVVLVVSAVVAVCAIVYGLAAGEPGAWVTGIGATVVSMQSVIGLLLARLGSDLKFAGRI